MEKMYNYEAPVVEVIEVEVEKGFANSVDVNQIESSDTGWENGN